MASRLSKNKHHITLNPSRTLAAEHVWCQLFSEPGAGSDLGGLSTRAELDGDRYIINGQKVWCSGGRYSNWGILMARTNPEAAISATAVRVSNWGRWGEDDVRGTMNFLDADKRIYARYGGRDARSAESRISKAGLLYTMNQVLKIHRAESGKTPPPEMPAPNGLRCPHANSGASHAYTC